MITKTKYNDQSKVQSPSPDINNYAYSHIDEERRKNNIIVSFERMAYSYNEEQYYCHQKGTS